MGKRGIILSEEDKQRALANNLSLQTVYARINRGWDTEKAVTTAPKPTALTKLKRSSSGELIGKYGEPIGKDRTFRMLASQDKTLDELIKNSGLSQSEFIAKIITEYVEALHDSKQKNLSAKKRTKKSDGI